MGNKFGKLCASKIKFKKKLPKPADSSPKTPPSTIDELNQAFFEANNSFQVPEAVKNGTIPTFTCEICIESRPLNDSFNIRGCAHFYCTQCIVKYIISKLQDNVIEIHCPESDCPGVLEPHYCNPILPNKVLILWEKALCESLISESVRFYCPFQDCSALVVNDCGSAIAQSVCPHCKRNVCVNCRAPWHRELSCEKYQRMKHSNDDLMLDLAKRKEWRQCPNCKWYVEKEYGCHFMTCRCKHSFCYNCGKSFPEPFDTHVCSKCKE